MTVVPTTMLAQASSAICGVAGGVGSEACQAVLDANLLVAALVAVAAGLVSFASPCVLPLVPGYLSWMTGLTGEELADQDTGRRSRVVAGSLLFVAGFAVPIALIGVAAAWLNSLLVSRAWQVAMGVFVAAMGLAMLSGRLVGEVRVADRAPQAGLLGAPLLGFIFGVAWTPCIGPTFGAIIGLASSTSGGDAVRGALLGFAYATGLGIPFVLIGLGFRRASGALALLRRSARTIQRVGGGLLVAIGVAIATGLWNDFTRALLPLVSGFTLPI